ncbi:MAG: hypothetical protein WBQ09_10705 [Terriglobales bacterium]|jgi:hypothetical protein
MTPDEVLAFLAKGFATFAAVGMVLVLGLFAFARFLERRESGGSTKAAGALATGNLDTDSSGPTSDGPGSRVAMTGLTT